MQGADTTGWSDRTGGTPAIGPDASAARVEREIVRLLIERMRIAARLVLGVTLFYAVLDVLLSQPHRAALHSIEAAVIVIAVATLYLPRHPRLIAQARVVAVLLTAPLLVTVACGGLLRSDVQAAATLLVVIVLVAASMLPWGAAYQAVTALVALLCIGGIVAVDPTAVEILTREPAYIIAVGLGLGCSVPLADQHLRGRVEMLTEHERLRAAKAEISAMNAILEERVAERTAELEAAITDLRAFGYAISHDLRQPVRAIGSFAQILGDSAADRLREDEKDFTSRIHAAARRMDGLLDEFLRLSRVASRRMTRERVDLSACVRALAEERTERTPRPAVQWEIEPDLEVVGDAGLLTLLLEELVDNAWKFTDGCPETRIAFGAEPAGADTVYFVRDNGCGFAPERNEDVFKVFSRAIDGSDVDGFGTGLAAARRIVMRHGGRIWAEGRPGAGATVRFTLGTRTESRA